MISNYWKYKIIVTYINDGGKCIIENYNNVLNQDRSFKTYNDVLLDEKMNILINKKNRQHLPYINNKQNGLICLHVNGQNSFINRMSNYLPSNLVKIIFKFDFNKYIFNFPNKITHLNLGHSYVKPFKKIPFRMKEIMGSYLCIDKNVKTKFNKIKFTIINSHCEELSRNRNKEPTTKYSNYIMDWLQY